MRASKNKTIEPYHHEDAAVLLGAYSGFYPMKGKVMAIALSPDEKGKYIARVHFISKMGEYEHYFYTTDLELV